MFNLKTSVSGLAALWLSGLKMLLLSFLRIFLHFLQSKCKRFSLLLSNEFKVFISASRGVFLTTLSFRKWRVLYGLMRSFQTLFNGCEETRMSASSVSPVSSTNSLRLNLVQSRPLRFACLSCLPMCIHLIQQRHHTQNSVLYSQCLTTDALLDTFTHLVYTLVCIPALEMMHF